MKKKTREIKMINPSEDSKSLKDLLKDNQSLIKIIQSSKNIIEREYNDQEKVNEDFLFTMLSKGYIDENYSDFLSTSYEELFEKDEYAFLNNLKENNEPNFGLAIINIKSVKNKIKSYQWSSPSILNNDILTDLINKSQSSKLESFIIAILNYYEKYTKNDFIDQYVESINWPNDNQNIINVLLNELLKKLQSDIPIEIKKSLLLSFFSNNSGPLFCQLLYTNTNYDDIITKPLNSFFEDRQSVLVYTLNEAIKNEDLKKKLSASKLEIEKISIFSDATQQLLVNSAMFQLSKANLDYLIAKQKEIPPHYYYDFIRNKKQLKNKIFESADIEKFVNEILLTEKIINITPEGIVDLLFTTLILDDIAEKVTAKLSNEFIDLTYLPKLRKDGTIAILALNTSLFHILIEQNKIKIDFNNVLYLSSSCTAEDTILFAQKQINKQVQNISLYNIDTFAKNHFLSSFYSFLLTEQKVSLDLFEKESEFLILQNVDFLDLIDSIIKEKKAVTTNKMQMLVELAFKRTNLYNNSSKTFLTIIKENFHYFYNNFNRIRTNCYTHIHLKDFNNKTVDYTSNHCWVLNLSILLKNEFEILEQEHLNSIISIISFGDLNEIIKEWSYNIGIYNTSKIIDGLLNEKCINTWLSKFEKNTILNFINSIKNYLDYETEYKLISLIDKENISQINQIAQKYEIASYSIIDYNYSDSYFKEIIAHLQKDFNIHWEKIKNSAQKISHYISFNNQKMINNLFVLGRYFYDAMENGKIYVDDFFSEKNTTLLNFSKKFQLNPILCGLIFEAYFDQKGKLKSESKKLFFDQLVEHLEFYKGSKSLDFIKECLKLFNNRVIYIPGDPDIIFKINGNIIENEIEINSITCFGVELLTKPQNTSDTGILAVQGSKSDLIRSIRQYFTIPNYRIKLEPTFENYMIINGMDFIQPLSSIALLINKKKLTDKKLKNIEKDFT